MLAFEGAINGWADLFYFLASIALIVWFILLIAGRGHIR